MMASCAGSSAGRARVIHIEAREPARPALLLMNNRVKSIDHQLDCRRGGGTFATGIVETRRQAWKLRQWVLRQAARVPGPPICRGRSSGVSSLLVDLSLHGTAPQPRTSHSATAPTSINISMRSVRPVARRSVTSNRKKSADRNSRRNAGSHRKRCIKVIARSLDDY